MNDDRKMRLTVFLFVVGSIFACGVIVGLVAAIVTLSIEPLPATLICLLLAVLFFEGGDRTMDRVDS